MNRIFTNLKKKFNPGVVLGLYNVYDLYSQTTLLVYISDVM